VGESGASPGPPGPGARREARFPQRPGHGQPVGGHERSSYLANHGKRGPRGNDGAKKVKGRKRQILTDTGGRLLKVFVHPANEHDKWGGRALLAGMDLSLWPRVRKLFVDWGYRGLKETASSLGLELEVVARPYAGVRGVWVREGAEVPEIPRERGFKPLPKRWVVERTFAWLGRNRRLAKDYEENPRVSEAWVYLGMLRLLVKRLARAA
jgi:putative transposase